MEIKEEAISVLEAARKLNVCQETLRRLIRKKELKAFRLGKKTNYRIPITEIERILAGK